MSPASVIFLVVLLGASGLFARQVGKIRRNIGLGRPLDRTDRRAERWKVMARVALGQGKMVARPVAGVMHILIYVGFVVINIEVLEIVIDGVLGTHRVFSFLGPLYDVLIGGFEILAVGVLLACVVFLARRNVLRLKRFWSKEMTVWPRSDANIILIAEIILMGAFLKMNAADQVLAARGHAHYTLAGSYPVSTLLRPFFEGMSDATVYGLERAFWWVHIVGILAFLNYLPISKHFHIILAFPNTWYSKLTPRTQVRNMPRVTEEVKLMLDPNADPYAAPAEGQVEPERFGARDVFDLTWKSLMDAYSCTECGRCTSECPANITGKLLSPRKIMMDTRDRLEEVGRNIDRHGSFQDDGKSLHDRISEEELWACTTCNACTQACPVNIDPVDIIMEMRRYLVMEESRTRPALTSMFNNVENNGAPWAFGPDKRLQWMEEQ
ncbi:MAG: (Fe-S)-binding protein [Flavobacteriales bacterium]|nr:(Fe-S)-binding protein [Flavobacteriales bacterium]MCB9166270.1 (Fe-S)-binding protein [Flavobacteriales bacterium]